MQVVHTFNADRSREGTVEELPEKVAKALFRQGRARPATEEEVTAGKAAEPVPADDQMPLGAAAAPAQEGGPGAPALDQAAAPEPPAAASPPADTAKATAPKPGGTSSPPKPGTTTTSPASTTGATPGK